MMNFWKAFVLVVVVAVGVASCAVEGEELATGAGEGAEVSDPAAPDGAEPQLVTVPDELSFDLISDGTAKGSSFTAQACRVKLLYCRDARHNNKPSFCQNGCGWEQAKAAAYSLCRNNCGNIDCRVQWYDGGC